jgi:hypothetical protein
MELGLNRLPQDSNIAFSFPKPKGGLTARIKVPPKMQKIAAR